MCYNGNCSLANKQAGHYWGKAIAKILENTKHTSTSIRESEADTKNFLHLKIPKFVLDFIAFIQLAFQSCPIKKYIWNKLFKSGNQPITASTCTFLLHFHCGM